MVRRCLYLTFHGLVTAYPWILTVFSLPVGAGLPLCATGSAAPLEPEPEAAAG